jgi:N-acetylmuramoyl-L-alanine amidase
MRQPVLEKTLQVNTSPAEVFVVLRMKEEVPAALIDELKREREKWKFDVIVIDPGHGGKDPGALGRDTMEKNLTLQIGLALRNELEKRMAVKVIMTRSTDIFVPLEKRTQIANQMKGKLFISIHADSNPDKSLKGHTVYFMGPAKTDEARRVAQFENSAVRYEDSQHPYEELSDAAFILAANAQNSFNKESQEFAAMLDKEVKDKCSQNGHGVRQAGFYVLYGASMPNILLETAFISNKKDEKTLQDQDFISNIAQAICSSIIDFKARYEEDVL